MSVDGMTNSWIKTVLDGLILTGEIQKMIIVIPDGFNYRMEEDTSSSTRSTKNEGQIQGLFFRPSHFYRYQLQNEIELESGHFPSNWRLINGEDTLFG